MKWNETIENMKTLAKQEARWKLRFMLVDTENKLVLIDLFGEDSDQKAKKTWIQEFETFDKTTCSKIAEEIQQITKGDRVVREEPWWTDFVQEIISLYEENPTDYFEEEDPF